MDRKARLGRGLNALLSGGTDDAALPAAAQAEIPAEQIDQNPYQPRRTFDDDELKSLADSVRQHGILQPLVVRQTGDRYQLIAGERRLRAAKAVGLASVPVRVVDFNDQQVLEAALVENIQRTDLNPIEKAQAFKDYLERFGMTQEQLAERLGLARPTISNLVGLLDLPPEVQDLVRTKQLSVGHARLVKGIPDRDRQMGVCKDIIARQMSVHATEAVIKQMHQEAQQQLAEETAPSPKPATPPAEKTAHVKGIEDELRQKLALKVEIRVRGKDRGQIVLGFDSNDDFERLLEVLRR
jgi:ParB family chromosome partitioning protein